VNSPSVVPFLLLSCAACSSSSSPSPTVDSGPITTTQLSGTMGTLGAVQPTVSSYVISNSGESLVYLSSGPLTCPEIMVSRWLGSATAGSQVLELVISGDPKLKSYAVPDSEANYAAGGMSSATEKGASSGTIVFTEAATHGEVAGTIEAKYGTAKVTGVFRATFCDGGQGY